MIPDQRDQHEVVRPRAIGSSRAAGIGVVEVADRERQHPESLFGQLLVGREELVAHLGDRHLLAVPERVRTAVDDDVGRALDRHEVRLREDPAGHPVGAIVERRHELVLGVERHLGRRGSAARVSSASTPIFAASTTNAASVGSPITDPSSPTVASQESTSPRAEPREVGHRPAADAEDRTGLRVAAALDPEPLAVGSIVVAVIAFIVSVPVLSLLMTVVPPRVSTSVSDFTTALSSARCRAPDDSIVCTNVGRPTGIAEIAVEMHSRMSVSVSWPRAMPDDGDDRDRRPREQPEDLGHAVELALERRLAPAASR